MTMLSISKAVATGQSAFVREAFDDVVAATNSPPANATIIQAKVAELGRRLAGAGDLFVQADSGSDLSTYSAQPPSGGTGCTPKHYND